MRAARFIVQGSLIPLVGIELPTCQEWASFCTKTASRDQGLLTRIPVFVPISRYTSHYRSILSITKILYHCRTIKIMRNSFEYYVILLSLCCLLHLSESKDNVNGKAKTSRTHSKVFGKHPNGGLISFDSEQEEFRIDWAVTIPFLSIPFEHKIGENGEFPSLFNVNTKSLGIVGLMATLFRVVSPLFSKAHPQYNYRSTDNGQWLHIGNAINEMMFGNDYVVPCMQRIVCSIVSVAANSENPTSTDKIIDGLSSHSWFKDVTNGTIIQDAVIIGRKGNHNCAYIYKDCLITPKLLKTVMDELGIV